MVAFATDNLTMLDIAKAMDATGQTVESSVAMLLAQTNEILQDQVLVEGNLINGYQGSIQTGLPKVYYKMIGEPVRSSKATKAQISEGCSILEGRSLVEVDLLGGATGIAKERVFQSNAFMEAFMQRDASTMFYGSAANPKEYVGLANRYRSSTDGNGANILSAGGTTNLTSVWIIAWSDNTIFGTTPMGIKSGIEHKYLGEITITELDSEQHEVMREVHADRWKLRKGLFVKDWRWGIRIANVDTVALKNGTGTQAANARTNIVYKIEEGLSLLPSRQGVKIAIYGNRAVLAGLRALGRDMSQATVETAKGFNQFGKDIFTTSIEGIPFRICDQLIKAETLVA